MSVVLVAHGIEDMCAFFPCANVLVLTLVSVDLGIHPSRGNSQLKMGQFTAQNGFWGCGGDQLHREKVEVRVSHFMGVFELSLIPSFGPTPGVWSHSIIFGSRWLRALK